MAGGKAETALVLGIQHHITLNENTLDILSVGDGAQRGSSGREGPAGPHGTFPRILPPGPDFHVAMISCSNVFVSVFMFSPLVKINWTGASVSALTERYKKILHLLHSRM